MVRGLVIAGIFSLGLLSANAMSVLQDDEFVVEVEQLQDRLYVLRGGGGNSAAFITEDGVVLVDTKMPGWGQPLIDSIASITPKPVTTVINTHTHFDHVGGNVDFPNAVTIITHENTRRLMREWNDITGLNFAGENVFTESEGHGISTRTFSDRMSLGSGPDRVDLFYFGPGHTGGDAWVVFPALRTMHTGDMFPNKSVPLLDANNGGSGVGFPDTLQNAYDTVTDIDTIITGHSTQMTRAELEEYARFNRDFLNAVRNTKDSDLSIDDFVNSWQTPAQYEGYTDAQAQRLQSNAQVIFDELP